MILQSTPPHPLPPSPHWQLITTEGRAAIAADPMGDKFPWLPEGAEAAAAAEEAAAEAK